MEKLVRRPNAVILFISLSLLMMLTTGCQEIKLKAGIEAANKQCPIDMGETGKNLRNVWAQGFSWWGMTCL